MDHLSQHGSGALGSGLTFESDHGGACQRIDDRRGDAARDDAHHEADDDGTGHGDRDDACSDVACGADPEVQYLIPFCTGSNATCPVSQPTWTDWEPLGQGCDQSQICVSSNDDAHCETCEHGCHMGSCYECSIDEDCNANEHCESGTCVPDIIPDAGADGG